MKFRSHKNAVFVCSMTLQRIAPLRFSQSIAASILHSIQRAHTPHGHGRLPHFPTFVESKNPFLSASAFETYRRPFIYAEKRFRGYRPPAVAIRQTGHVPPFDRSDVSQYVCPNLDLCNTRNKMNDSMCRMKCE